MPVGSWRLDSCPEMKGGGKWVSYRSFYLGTLITYLPQSARRWGGGRHFRRELALRSDMFVLRSIQIDLGFEINHRRN